MSINLYLDTNLYRYIATKELVINTYGDVTFSYSTAHFDDMIANEQNHSILSILERAKAGEIVSNEDRKHDLDFDAVRLDYTDPEERFNEYASNSAATQEFIQPMLDLMMVIYGGSIDDFRSKIPADILSLTDELEFMNEPEARKPRQAAIDASVDMQSALKDFHPEPLPTTRAALGLRSGASGAVNASKTNPIEVIWDKINPNDGEHSIKSFFGSKLSDDIENGISRVQSAALCHMMLNMIGYYPDGGLSDQEKQAAIMADGDHIAYGSYCDGFLTSDLRMYNKAKAIYEYKQYPSKVGHVKYDKLGMELNVFDPAIIDSMPDTDVKEYIRANPIFRTK